MSLLTRLLLLVLLAVLPALGVGAYHEFELRQIREEQVHSEALRLARLANAEMGRIAEGTRQLLTAFAENPAVDGHDWDACNAAAARLLGRLDGYFNIGIVTTGGDVVCSALPQGRSVNIGTSPAFRQAVGADRFAAGTYETSRVDGTAILPFAEPLADGRGKVGLVFATLRLDWLRRHFADRFLGPDVTLLLVDRNGTILLRLPDPERWQGKMLDAKYSAQLNAPKEGTAEVTGVDGVGRIIGYSPLNADPLGIYVGVGLTRSALFGSVDAATIRGSVLVALCLALALLAAWAGGTAFLRRPVRALLRAAERWRTGDYSARSGLTDPRSEITRLGHAFDEMAVALERREGEIRHANEMLEQRVADRTAELVDANRRLAVETEERRRAETALQHAQKMEAIGQLTGGVAHDFNNLLTAVLGNLELAQMRVKDDGIQKLLGGAARAAQRGASLTEQLLAFSRKQHLQLRPVDINELVRSMSEMLNRSLGATVQVELCLADALWPAMADPNQVELVILNLAINARDAMPAGGRLRIETSNSRASDDDRPADIVVGDCICIAVGDTGIGMSEAVMAHALEPFFTTKEPGRGSGLGLSMVYGVAKQSGGGVTLSSELGRGTTVRVYLPRAVSRPAVQGAAPTADEVDLPALAGRSILLIDDDSDVREVTTTLLDELGCRIVAAPSGEGGLAALAREPTIDAAIVDFAMPGMNGLEVADQIERRCPHLPIVIVTGYADTGLADLRRRGLHILNKPFSRHDLAAALLAAFAEEAGSGGNVVPLRPAATTS